MSTPEPTITGELSATPFLHLVVNLHLRALTGTLAVWPETETRGQDRIYFVSGVPVTARLLVSNTPVLDRALLPLFARTAGAFAFYEQHDLVGEGGIRGRVEPLALLSAALRMSAREDAMQAVLGQYEDATLRLRPGLDLKRYAFLPKEERVLEVARAGPSTLTELVETTELGPELSRRLVYLLLITRALEPYVAPASTPHGGVTRGSISPERTSRPRTSGTSIPAASTQPPPGDRNSNLPLPPSRHPSGPPAGHATSPPRQSAPPRTQSELPPQGLSADALAFFVEAKQRIKQLETQNYFDMLGVARDAGAETVRKQFLQLAKRWHPDRLAPELASLRPDVEDIFRWLTTAHDTLVDDTKRANHLRAVQDGGGTPEADRKLAAIVTAAMEQQKAEVLIKRRDFVGARTILERALDLNAEDADLQATYAWALFNSEPGETFVPDMIRHLDRALAIAPTHDRAHFYKALALRRIGREAEAIKHFKLASDANPKNLDALREVRLARMRGQLEAEGAPPKKPAGAKGEESFLSKLFGSPKKKT
jgi:curved DNA-binding protein CbpA